MRQMFANDMAAGRPEDVADEEDIHPEMLAERVIALLSMAINGRFDLGLRILLLLAEDPGKMHTSAAIAETLGESAVMVRRAFLQLHKAGFIAQRKGPNGGARLKLALKEIGVGDLYAAVSDSEAWLLVTDKALALLLKRTADDAVKAMNETTLAQLAKRLKKG